MNNFISTARLTEGHSDSNAAFHLAVHPKTTADYEHRALTFDPNKYGGVGGAERAGCDADVLAVVGQGDVFDGQSSSRLRYHVCLLYTSPSPRD